MTTTAQMVERETRLPDETAIHTFCDDDSIKDLRMAAKAVQKLGFDPEIRFVDAFDEPWAVELYVRPCRSLVATLRASLDAPKERAR